MYIEFCLPTGRDFTATAYVNSEIHKNLRLWAEQYEIQYTTKLHKYKVRVTFDDDKCYSIFAMTWSPDAEHLLSYIKNYKLIEPMARPE